MSLTLLSLTAKDIMSDNLITVKEDDSVLMLMEILNHAHISGVPVVNDAGECIGIVSKTDLSGAKVVQVLRQGLSLEELKVRQLLNNNIIVSILEDSAVTLVASVMTEQRIHRVLVKNNASKLVGILTTFDITRAFSELDPSQSISSKALRYEVNQPSEADTFNEMTLKENEIQILRLVARDKTIQEMSEVFHLHQDELKASLSKIMDKLKAASPKEAVAVGIEMGLLKL